jgi:hypothetical protein
MHRSLSIHIGGIPERFMFSPTQGRLFNLYFVKHGRKVAHRSFIHIKDNVFLNLAISKPQFGNFSHRRLISVGDDVLKPKSAHKF